MESLKNLRDHIDLLDNKIASLLEERFAIVEKVGEVKQKEGLSLIDEMREKEVLGLIEKRKSPLLFKEHLNSIYRNLLEESRKLQHFLQKSSLSFSRIGIIGLGLMGGSLAKALKSKKPSLILNTFLYPSEDTSLAIEGGWIDKVYPSLQMLGEHSELLLLCSPISTILPLAKELAHLSLSHKLLVMDIASVKEEIASTFENLSKGSLEFIATHSMAGKEKKGFLHSQATLFVSRPWIVVCHKKNLSSSLERIQELILFLGAEPLEFTKKAHNEYAVLISHLTATLSKLFLDFVKETSLKSLQMKGPGFASFTRLTHENEELQKEIAQYNHENIERYFSEFLLKLKNLSLQNSFQNLFSKEKAEGS